jgi:hypothetical protein
MHASKVAAVRRALSACAVAAVAMMAAPRAFACGASAGGAAGVSACSLDEHLESVRPKWRAGASYAYNSTALRLGGTRFDNTRSVVFATLDYRFTPAWALEIGAGSILGGTLGMGPERYDFDPGLLVAAGASWRIVEADGARPFVALTGQIAFVATTTRPSDVPSAPSTGYEALDARIGAVAGWPLFGVLTPYALARAFGGPVFWSYHGESVTGGDVHHYQFGAGLLARWGRIDIFAEGVPLGEQSISAGVGLLL